MQNYLNAEHARIKKLSHFMSKSAVSLAAPKKQEPALSEPMSIVVFPEAPFVIDILYNRKFHSHADAGRIGRELLTEMQKIIDGDK